MVAQVVVNHQSKQVDKLFDYLIPEGLQVTVGSRVIVPFGAGNRQKEAYVFGIAAGSRAKNLKEIIRLADAGRVFDEKMLDLIYWMREKYFCSFLDIIRAIIPAGTSVKPEEWIVLKADSAEGKDRKLLDVLRNNGGAAEVNYLMQFFETNISAQLKKLCDAGVLKREYRDTRLVKDKTVRVASLAVSVDDAGELIGMLTKKRAAVQAKMLEILCMNEIVSLSDLIQFTEGSYNAISALEKKGYIRLKNIVVSRAVYRSRDEALVPPELTKEQRQAVCAVEQDLEQGAYAGVLLHGVTGSGKTEVYMRLIERVINRGKQAVLLVPEIALTPQMVARFTSRFGERVAVFHSGLSLGEKYDEWKRMRDGEADIVIGARSAVFAPFSNIGIIIIDEEHETSYKSEMLPRYDTREVAAFRARQYGAVLLLASATPQVTSYYKAKAGEYRLLEMKNRVNSRRMPAVSIVDMRQELENGNKSVFSAALQAEIAYNLQNKEQTILFLNRRGFSTFVSCRSCGFVAECPNCNISLTYHKFNDTLRCHYCGYSVKNYQVCPACGSKYIRYFGGGTQKVEEEIKALFPSAATLRMDVDTTGRQGAHEAILREFQQKKTDILIGTQMVAKGLDFPNVTLVGVISADTMLNIDDFRAGERTFDLLEQVTGRAGRAGKPGRAVIQTYNPDHEAVVLAKAHDYKTFYETEIQMRKALWYPPFSDIVSILFAGSSEALVPQAARFFAKQLQGVKKLPQKSQVLGPVPASISRIKNKFRWRILIKCEDADGLGELLNDAQKACRKNALYGEIAVVIDKNPNNIY